MCGVVMKWSFGLDEGDVGDECSGSGGLGLSRGLK